MDLYEGCIFPIEIEETPIEEEMRTIVKQRINLEKLATEIGQMEKVEKEKLTKIDVGMKYLTRLTHGIINVNDDLKRPAYSFAKYVQTGSQRYNMSTGKSDLDLLLLLQPGDEVDSRKEKITVLKDIFNEIKRKMKDGDSYITSADPRFIDYQPWEDQRKRKPPAILILKTNSGLSIDICVEDMDGLLATSLMAAAKAKASPIMRPMMQTLKLVGKTCGVVGPQHYPSSTALTHLVMNYLQRKPEPVLGPVNMDEIKFDDPEVRVKFQRKGGLDSLGREFMAQAEVQKLTTGALQAAKESMRPAEGSGSQQEFLPTEKKFRNSGTPSPTEVLKRELVAVCRFLGDPWRLPEVIDLAHPKSVRDQPDYEGYEPHVRIVCPYVINRSYGGNAFQRFSAVFKGFGQMLEESSTMIQVPVRKENPGSNQRKKMQQ